MNNFGLQQKKLFSNHNLNKSLFQNILQNESREKSRRMTSIFACHLNFALRNQVSFYLLRISQGWKVCQMIFFFIITLEGGLIVFVTDTLLSRFMHHSATLCFFPLLLWVICILNYMSRHRWMQTISIVRENKEEIS